MMCSAMVANQLHSTPSCHSSDCNPATGPARQVRQVDLGRMGQSHPNRPNGPLMPQCYKALYGQEAPLHTSFASL